MASRKAADAGSASYDSSSSASSDDDVLITKKHRQKLQGLNTPRVKPEAPAPAPAAAPPPVTKSPLNKPDHICGVCERDGGDLMVCTGSCVSAFHVACLPRAHRDAASCSSTGQWKCPSCVTNTHVCFHCKERGRVVVSDASTSPDDAASHSADETNTKPALRAVVKCRALSCGKFYHQKCIAKLPLARIAGARFICPLHTCAACEQSGAKKEPVRCTRCPVAYHTSCLPRNGVVPLPGKRIICPKHEGQPLVMEDEEEKERAHEEEGEVVEPVIAKQAPAIARVTVQEDQDADVSVAASSPRTEENENEAEDDARSETSTSATTSSGVKKHSKSSKKDKKKKKKKKKKDKKSKDKERSSKGGDEASSEKEDGGKKVKRSSKSSSSNKAGRRTDEDDGHGDDTGEERDEKKTSSAVHTASEDDDEEEKATVVVTESVAVKKEESVVPSSSPQPESQDSHESTKGATVSADVASAEEEPAAVMNAFDDEPKPEPEREEQVGTATPPSQIERADDVKLMLPLPQSNEEPVVSETVSPHGDHEEPREDEKASEPFPALDVLASTERASPSPAVKNDPPYRADDDSRDHLTVQIPEISMSGLATGDDGEVDEDSGSGSGSQSNKARNSDKHTTEDVVKEKPSGGSSRSKKSKKKQRKGGGKGGGDESVKREGDAAEPREEAKWVQCDDCKKWRTVAKEIDLDAMPETWSCTMNTWNKAFASCDVPEEVVETKKSSSKPNKRAALGEVGTPVLKKTKLTKQNSVPELVQTPAAQESIATAVPEKEAKIVKKADKDSKKRKLKLKLREKYGEVHWVQCENKQCGKWRVVPSSASTLPSVWYCSLNTWAPELASCSAANPPEVEAYLSKSQSKKPSGTRPPKRQRGPDNGDQTNLAAASAQGDAVAPARPAGIKPIKNSGGGKSATPTAHASGGSVGSGTAAGASVGGVSGTVVDARAGAKALTGVKSVVLEWAQCEKCLKWRKLPAHIKSSTLPDKWFCSMNHWDPPSRASCAVPQEDDQEPLVDASPLPSSQNWYPMPGQVSGNTSTGTGTSSAMRSKRGKLSYSELLYASTGQLRKTYTSESSTLSFEYEGTVYHRDDQYNKSSLYLSPLTTNKLTGEPIDPQRKDKELSLFSNTSAQKALVDKVATVILSTIDLRRDFAITEIVDNVLNDGMVSGEGDLSLSVITTAIAQLVACGELEKVDRSQTRHEWPPSSGDTTTASILLRSLSSQPAFYRKVPKRPLKALKAWKLAVRL